MDFLYLKHLLVRTPLEEVGFRVRAVDHALKRLTHPAFREIYLESQRIRKAMERLLTPTSNCIDVGAHLGSMLNLMLKLAPHGRHLAFEPVPRKALWLRRKFPEVQVYQLALADRVGKALFVDDPNQSGLSRLMAPPDANGQARKAVVHCDMLDRVVSQHERVHFIKIDVEGAELLVLRGAVKVLERDRPAILFESGLGGASRFGLTIEQLYSFLVSGNGYSIFLIKDYLAGREPMNISQFSSAHVFPPIASNYLALRQ